MPDIQSREVKRAKSLDEVSLASLDGPSNVIKKSGTLVETKVSMTFMKTGLILTGRNFPHCLYEAKGPFTNFRTPTE